MQADCHLENSEQQKETGKQGGFQQNLSLHRILKRTRKKMQEYPVQESVVSNLCLNSVS